MAVVHAGPGRIELFNDFFVGLDQSDITDNSTTADVEMAYPFIFFGEGTTEIDSGMLALNVLSGAVRLTATNETDHLAAVGTYNTIKISLMAPVILEARVQFDALTTRRAFFGLTDAEGGDEKKDLVIEENICASTGVAFTPVASDYVGFLMSSEMTAPDNIDWHYMFRGGTEAQTTVSTTYDLNTPITAGDWQILRLEVDPNGTTRWLVDNILLKEVVGACAVDVALGVVLGAEVVSGTTALGMDVDYLLVEANRDWTV